MKLFHLLFIILRFAWPLLLILAVYLILQRRRRKSNASDQSWQKTSEKPDFNGPVVEVDYRVLDEDEET